MLGLGRFEADVRHDQLAAVEAAGRDLVPHLTSMEGDGQLSGDGLARNLPGRGIHARGDVDGDKRSARAVHRPDLLRRFLPRRAAETSSEQGVDDDVGVAYGPLLPAVRAQELGGNPSVATVRSPTAHRGERPGGRESSQDLVGYGAARALHQLLDVVPRFRRLHLGGGVERLKHPRR